MVIPSDANEQRKRIGLFAGFRPAGAKRPRWRYWRSWAFS